MDIEFILDGVNMWYNEFIDWYLLQPIYAQIFVIIGILVIFALAITLIYYIIKGIFYLVYYILKGTYLLLKGIGFVFFKIFEGFYKLVSGTTKFQTKRQAQMNDEQAFTNKPKYSVIYCSECGKKFTPKMIHRLSTNMSYN